MVVKKRGDDGSLKGSFFNSLPSLFVASHELKSPLALVRQLSLMLQEGDYSPSEQKRLLSQISLTSEKALRLTSDLTKSVRLNDALFKLEPINAKQLCEDVVREMSPMFIAHSKKVRLVSSKKMPLIVGNRDLLRRVIMNLSDNAIHYTEDGEGVEIKINSRNFGKTIRVGVRDFGPALPKNTIKNLNNKLSGFSTTSIHARPQSSGLGLYIISQFADAMNGQVGLIRHRDGATFYIDLQSSNQLSLL